MVGIKITLKLNKTLTKNQEIQKLLQTHKYGITWHFGKMQCKKTSHLAYCHIPRDKKFIYCVYFGGFKSRTLL